MHQNRQWVLDKYPEGSVLPTVWRLQETVVPELGAHQILVQTKWLSMDPYMRGRMSAHANYTSGVGLGEVMHGGGVAQVIASRHRDWKEGDLVETMGLGWQEYAILNPDVRGPMACHSIPSDVPPQASLSWLGMPGLTAYVGLTQLARPLPGDTVVVSAASGAVGQVAGQIAKLMGAHVIAIAGHEDKCAWCREIGYDATINYRTCTDWSETFQNLAPSGVNVFFDNTGGSIHDAVLAHLAPHAQVVICGRIAVSDKQPHEDIGLRASSRLIVTRASLHGLVVFDWWHKRDEAMTKLAQWYRDGQLRFKEDIVEGFENAPEAFCRMMRGENQGKQLVKL